MARQKSYDRQDAVAKARDAFREHGFQTLGIRAIEDIVGIGRFAIRTEFGGKDGLFLEALKLYGQDIRRTIVAPIEQSDTLDTLDRLWSSEADIANGAGEKYGCLYLNTTVENAALQNDAIREQTAAYFNHLLVAATGLVERAKAKGEVREDVDAHAAGEFVKGMMMASALINRDAGDVAASEGLRKMARATVNSWRVSA
ncbi:transcriptional regulator, TetR family [Monaibacterium marinum]|uniref:Transcriptional regulator, TetR family n=1 Tax=Pontivivens marinum TaxID=1690039 RepID=A0A2C9CVL1_9RHOB|nr:TetR family transcriptional regulator [Monaibacterium marinum]SOH95344.1 transcriptional regulator, TetR family [Monaibacterium marinum]